MFPAVKWISDFMARYSSLRKTWNPESGSRRGMSLNSNKPKELPLHPVECLWVSMLQVTERLPEPKRARAAEWTKHHSKRIELSSPAEE
jgi:hypothetical protein